MMVAGSRTPVFCAICFSTLILFWKSALVELAIWFYLLFYQLLTEIIVAGDGNAFQVQTIWNQRLTASFQRKSLVTGQI
jgi:hypothetical protein